MKSLVTRVSSYVTGDALADAVLSYSLALARAQQVDQVEVPFRSPDGRVARVRLRVGWMADMDAVTHEARGAELTDPEALSELKAREDALHPDGSSPLEAADLLELDVLGEY